MDDNHNNSNLDHRPPWRLTPSPLGLPLALENSTSHRIGSDLGCDPVPSAIDSNNPVLFLRLPRKYPYISRPLTTNILSNSGLSPSSLETSPLNPRIYIGTEICYLSPPTIAISLHQFSGITGEFFDNDVEFKEWVTTTDICSEKFFLEYRYYHNLRVQRVLSIQWMEIKHPLHNFIQTGEWILSNGGKPDDHRVLVGHGTVSESIQFPIPFLYTPMVIVWFTGLHLHRTPPKEDKISKEEVTKTESNILHLRTAARNISQTGFTIDLINEGQVGARDVKVTWIAYDPIMPGICCGTDITGVLGSPESLAEGKECSFVELDKDSFMEKPSVMIGLNELHWCAQEMQSIRIVQTMPAFYESEQGRRFGIRWHARAVQTSIETRRRGSSTLKFFKAGISYIAMCANF